MAFEPQPQFSPLGGFGSVSPKGKWYFTQQGWRKVQPIKIGLLDVVKEIPQATKTVIGSIAKTAKQTQEFIAQSGGSVTLTGIRAITGKKIPEITSEELEDFPVQKAFKELVFGKDPIKSIERRMTETEITLKERGIEIPFVGQVVTPEQIVGKEKLLSILGVLTVIGIDFTGAGGSKAVIKTLTRLGKADDVAKVLKQVNVADDLIPVYSKRIALLTKADDIKRELNQIQNIQKTTKVPKTRVTPKPVERGFITSVKRVRPDIPLRVGGQYVPRSTDRLARVARNLIARDIDEAIELAKQTDERGVATASELIKHFGDEALKTTNKATRTVLYDKASDVAHFTAQNLTEQGRAIQAASILGRLTPEGMLRFAAKEFNKYNEVIDKSLAPGVLKAKKIKLTAEQIETILKGYKRIEKMENGIEKAMAFRKLTDSVSNMIPSPLFKKLVSIWKAGLLTGIKTTGINIYSNLFHGISEIIKDIPGVVVDSVTSLFTGKRALALTTGELKGVREGFEKGWRYLSTGFDERNIGVKLDRKKVNFGKGKLAKVAQKYEETVFQLLGAQDQPFYYGAKARSLQSQAIAEASNNGLKGAEAKAFVDDLVSNPTDQMVRYAMGDAEMAVFQNPTTLGNAAKVIQRLAGGAGEIVVPFGRTPAAVANQLINYSPIGIVKAIAINIGKGRFNQRLFSQAMGRGITGTAIMYLGGELYKKDLINLTRPRTERERKLWEAEGRRENTFFDPIQKKWRNVAVLGPGGFGLVVGGAYQQSLEENGSFIHALSDAFAIGTASLKEQSFLQGVSQVVETLSDPKRFFEGFFLNTLSSVIPTLVSDVAKVGDPLERRTTGILEKFKKRIPGARETLEPQITILGEQRKRGGNWLETMIDPSRPSKVIERDVVEELRRLTDEGFKISPTQLGDREGYPGLEPREVTALWEKAGEIISSKLSNLIKHRQYKLANDDDKADLVSGIIGKSNTVARALMVMALTEDLTGKALREKLSELKASKLMTKEVYKTYLDFGDVEPKERKIQLPEGTEIDESSLIHTIKLYAEAIGADPFTAFHRLFTGQRIRRLDSGAIIVERMPFGESQSIREDRGAGEELILDHTIPLQLGGSNSEGNLKLVPVSVWELYTPIENHLGRLLRAGQISKRKAQQAIKDFKENKISAEEVLRIR